MGNEANILNSKRNTPLIKLCHVVLYGCARILVKLESHNPTGSMKDRMARAVVAGAVSRGELVPEGTIVRSGFVQQPLEQWTTKAGGLGINGFIIKRTSSIVRIPFVACEAER